MHFSDLVDHAEPIGTIEKFCDSVSSNKIPRLRSPKQTIRSFVSINRPGLDRRISSTCLRTAGAGPKKTLRNRRRSSATGDLCTMYDCKRGRVFIVIIRVTIGAARQVVTICSGPLRRGSANRYCRGLR